MNSPLASRAMNSLYSPTLCGFICHRFFSLRPSYLWSPNLRSCNPLPRFRSNDLSLRFNGGGPSPACQVHSLVASVMEELESIRSSRRLRIMNKVRLPASKEVSEVKVEKRALQKGLLLEYLKDSQKLSLAVTQKPDGKENWMVLNQNGAVSSIKPQQVTYIVPGIEDFKYADLPAFIRKAHDLLDPTMLEYAWAELLEKETAVTVEESAEIIYGSREPLECYVPISCYRKMKFILMKLSAKDLALFMSLDLLFRWRSFHIENGLRRNLRRNYKNLCNY